jgi:hypothetical protein
MELTGTNQSTRVRTTNFGTKTRVINLCIWSITAWFPLVCMNFPPKIVMQLGYRLYQCERDTGINCDSFPFIFIIPYSQLSFYVKT